MQERPASVQPSASLRDGTLAICLEAGYASLVSDDAVARRAFEQGAQLAQALGDTDALALSAAGMLLAMAVEYADFRGLEHWAAVLKLHGEAAHAAGGPLDRLRLDAARIALPALHHDHGFDEHTDAAAARVAAALREAGPASPDERVLLAKMAIDYHSQQHDVPAIERLVPFIHAQLGAGGVSPVWQARWWLLLLLNHEYFADPLAAEHARQRARALAQAHGFPWLRFELACIDMSAVLKADDLPAAERLYREIEGLKSVVRPGRMPQGLRAQALYLARRGAFEAALDKVQLLLGLCADVEVPRRDQGAYEVLRAYCLAALARFDAADEVLASLRPHQKGQQGKLLDAIVATVQAMRALAGGRADAAAVAADALQRCAALRFNRFLLPLPQWSARLVEAGWDQGIEPEFLAAAVRDRRLVPEDPTREHWPWRLRVHALGELRIVRDGQALAGPAPKGQRKPLELLRLLAAHGGGPLPQAQVIDELWPSLEADAPKASFEMAVSRLRRLLELPEAVRVAEGVVQLDPAIVWVDVAAFEVLCRRADEASTERALALYVRPLLGSEPLAGLASAARERLALLHAASASAQGQRLQDRGEWARAQALYERALAHDMLNEPLHRELMHCQLRQGERAQALRSYLRCRELLQRALGAEPSARTRALAREAGAPGA